MNQGNDNLNVNLNNLNLNDQGQFPPLPNPLVPANPQGYPARPRPPNNPQRANNQAVQQQVVNNHPQPANNPHRANNQAVQRQVGNNHLRPANNPQRANNQAVQQQVGNNHLRPANQALHQAVFNHPQPVNNNQIPRVANNNQAPRAANNNNRAPQPVNPRQFNLPHQQPQPVNPRQINPPQGPRPANAQQQPVYPGPAYERRPLAEMQAPAQKAFRPRGVRAGANKQFYRVKYNPYNRNYENFTMMLANMSKSISDRTADELLQKRQQKEMWAPAPVVNEPVPIFNNNEVPMMINYDEEQPVMMNIDEWPVMNNGEVPVMNNELPANEEPVMNNNELPANEEPENEGQNEN